MLKVKGTELLQATTELAMDVGGPMSMPIWAEELAALSNEPDVGPEWATQADRQLPVPARRLDLRRHQRDPEEHPDQGGAGAVMDFEPLRRTALLKDSVTPAAGDRYSFDQRKGYHSGKPERLGARG